MSTIDGDWWIEDECILAHLSALNIRCGLCESAVSGFLRSVPSNHPTQNSEKYRSVPSPVHVGKSSEREAEQPDDVRARDVTISVHLRETFLDERIAISRRTLSRVETR